MTTTPTQNKLYEMLTMNTGRHMLDSGDHYGRNYERNAMLTIEDFINAPRASLDQWGEITISLFHHLEDSLTYESALDVAYVEFTRDSEDSHLEDIENFLEYIGASVSYSENSYNYESALSQVIQYTVFTLSGGQYVALQVHGGADVRGGYTRPVIFALSDECALLSEWGTIYCTGEDHHALEYSGGEWTLDGEYSRDFNPYQLASEGRKVGVIDYIPCPVCGYALEGTVKDKVVSA